MKYLIYIGTYPTNFTETKNLSLKDLKRKYTINYTLAMYYNKLYTEMKYHLIPQKAFLHWPFCASPFIPFFFIPLLSARTSLCQNPRSLLRFEVPGSANKVVICRTGCYVAVCHVPRRHEIAFRSKRAKMAREETPCANVCAYQ